MSMGLEPMWTDLSDMLATCTDDQLLKWKEVAENPKGDNFRFITTLRQVVVHMYNKRAKDIIDELSIAVNNEINSRNGDMDNKLEARIAKLECFIKNEANDLDVAAESFEVASAVSDAFKAAVNFRNKLVNSNKVSGEFDDLIEDVNEMFGDLQLADQLASKIARLSHKRYV